MCHAISLLRIQIEAVIRSALKKPEVGSMFRYTEKPIMSNNPTQKEGMDIPTNDAVMMLESIHLPLNRAHIIANGIDRQMIRMSDVTDNSKVAGNRDRISSKTGFPLM